MGDVVKFRPAPRRPRDVPTVDFDGLIAVRDRPPAEVIPSPAPINFRRWVRCLDVERAAWSCLRHLYHGGSEGTAEALRWWYRHRDEALRIGSKTMKQADLETFWRRYHVAVRARIDEIKAEHRTPSQWKRALAYAARRYPETPASSDLGPGRDGVA